MKFKEFGEIVEPAAKFQEFGEIVQERSQPSKGRSVASAYPKGLIKGATDLASLKDPFAQLLGAAGVSKVQEKALEEGLPTRDEPLEGFLERAGKLTPAVVGGGGSVAGRAARTALGAGLGELTKQYGGGPIAQGIAETAGFVAPGFGKKLIPSKGQKEAVDFLRNEGFAENEIVPLIKSENFINRFFSKVIPKGKKETQLGQTIKEKLGSGFDILKKEGEGKSLTGSAAVQFDDTLSDVLSKINPRFARLIEKDVEALRDRGISQKNLIDFYQDINAVVKNQSGGKAVLNILKKPILEGLKKIDPEAAKKFNQLNALYARGATFMKNLKPGVIDKLFSGARGLATLGSLVIGNLSFLGKALGTHAAQSVIRELLLNPRLQNLHLQMMKAVSQNKLPVALRIMHHFAQELRKTNAKAADSILQNSQNPRPELHRE